jgi:hypothetical protein
VQTFTAVPTRTNGDDVLYSWFNVLKEAGVSIESFLGSFLGETSFTIANNQVAAADVTGLTFSGAAIRSFVVDYHVYRNTTGAGATELAESGTLMGVYSSVAGTWEITQTKVGNSGVEFTITNAGQIQYTSDNITGTPATSEMKFKARTTGV